MRFFPLRVVLTDQINKVFFRLDMGKADKFINFPLANLAFIFHNLYLRQSSRQQQAIWSQPWFVGVP